MATSNVNPATLQTYLRIKYRGDPTGLRRLADETFAEATETVTLTANSHEGGSASGVINCPKGLLLEAIMDVLAEIDPAARAAKGSNRSICVFR